MNNRVLGSCLAITMMAGSWLQLQAQSDRWQQRVKYTMDVKVDAPANQFSGKQHLEYYNNSPDTLKKVFYHLYWNAFQPNSMMDVRSRELGKIVIGKDKKGNNRLDWDNRVRDRISKLQPDEIGYQKIRSLKRDGKPQEFKVVETILEVVLDKPVLPNSKAVFDLEFDAQVPVQIRRSGRNSTEGVDYSMAQWYPKMCEYDYEGWHATPYIAREFYGVWGDYDVKITIDKKYVLGGTGYLQNPNQIGHGYEAPGTVVNRPAGNNLTWHFIAPNVHDFMWAADPDYKHISRKIDGFTAHFLYLENETTRTTWPQLVNMIPKAYEYIKAHYGPYPYQQFSFIQGGDGGMEYPMSTLIMGNGKMDGLYGVAIHEWMHSWYQGMMATNESLYPWMDEGFTTFAQDNTIYNTVDSLKGLNPHEGSYAGYFALAKSPFEEPATTHSDHYNTNFGYSVTAYSKGAVFLEQLGYVIGAENRDNGLLRYYKEWRFKHPNVNDFIRVMEKQSGIELDWYKQYFINSTKHIDYGIDSVYANGNKTVVRLRRIGYMPMPVDFMVTDKNGNKVLHYIPLSIMFGEKPNEYTGVKRVVENAWYWTNPTYEVEVNVPLADIRELEIDPSERMADMDRSNNKAKG
ncbi:M1 family metallopeptidase [Chitinophaga nivalis]|uniref:M1 family metallopeptidase n=1 Tax=Chitinophaga nivalis TaxID=2991709 RepID=A0ABT3ISM4_9BACT|nr:M1 family metallopeptidase [Chitinophaga nivalis]MCW3463337.1 M1 family metallopeptidase [Chitinophaga nivalis]MCW3486973.1 M1 family metallopeptidase [Chitinophaga nivalis]